MLSGNSGRLMFQQSLTARSPPTHLGCVNVLPVLLHLRALVLGDAYRKISRYNESLCCTKAEQDSMSPDILGILFMEKNSYLLNVIVTKYLIETTTRKEGFMVAGSQFQRDLSSLWWERQGRLYSFSGNPR